MSLDLARLAADPECVNDLGPENLPALIGEAEALRARLWARLQAASLPAATSGPKKDNGPDKLLTAEEAASILGVNKRWMYRKADELPFTRRLSGGTLRFSEKGIVRWQETRK